MLQSTIIEHIKHIDMKRLFYFFSVLSILVSCQTSMIDANKVDRIVFYPIPKGVKYTLYLRSFPQILQHNERDSVILDRSGIKEFCSLLNSLEYEEFNSLVFPEDGMCYDDNNYYRHDFRCGVLLKMKSGAEISYCFGEDKGIFYNGCRLMKDYQPIFDYIDKNIYDTKSKYYWYDDEMRAIMEFIEKDQQQFDSSEAAQQSIKE